MNLLKNGKKPDFESLLHPAITWPQVYAMFFLQCLTRWEGARPQWYDKSEIKKYLEACGFVVEFCAEKNTGAEILLLKNNDLIIGLPRGSDARILDWFMNFRAIPIKTKTGRAHRGFARHGLSIVDNWMDFATSWNGWSGQVKILGGHSQGGASSDQMLAHSNFCGIPVQKQITSGKPSGMSEDQKKHCDETQSLTIRFQDDIVPEVSGWTIGSRRIAYHKAGRELWIGEDGKYRIGAPGFGIGSRVMELIEEIGDGELESVKDHSMLGYLRFAERQAAEHGNNLELG